MDDVTAEIFRDQDRADRSEKSYYCEVRDRDTDDVLFRGPYAETRQMAKHLAIARLAVIYEAVAGNPAKLTREETFADVHRN